MKVRPAYLAAAAVVAVALAYSLSRRDNVIRDVAWGVGGAAVDAVDGLISGAVVGAGQLVGIPATSVTACERAKAEGRTWDASFACPAGDFIKYLWR